MKSQHFRLPKLAEAVPLQWTLRTQRHFKLKKVAHWLNYSVGIPQNWVVHFQPALWRRYAHMRSMTMTSMTINHMDRSWQPIISSKAGWIMKAQLHTWGVTIRMRTVLMTMPTSLTNLSCQPLSTTWQQGLKPLVLTPMTMTLICRCAHGI